MTEPTALYEFKRTMNPLTRKKASEFQETNGELRLNGYELALGEMVEELDHILDATDFITLKKELTLFVSERRDLHNWLFEKFNMQTGRYDLE